MAHKKHPKQAKYVQKWSVKIPKGKRKQFPSNNFDEFSRIVCVHISLESMRNTVRSATEWKIELSFNLSAKPRNGTRFWLWVCLCVWEMDHASEFATTTTMPPPSVTMQTVRRNPSFKRLLKFHSIWNSGKTNYSTILAICGHLHMYIPIYVVFFSLFFYCWFCSLKQFKILWQLIQYS